MLCRTLIRKSLALALALSLLNACAVASLAAAPEKELMVSMGAISITGEVRVNGATTFSGSTIFSGTTIETGQASSALVKLSRGAGIELLPNSVLTLSFDEKGVQGSLVKGQTRFSTQTGFEAIVQTREGAVLAGAAQPNLFLVSAECGGTTVYAKQGEVELQAANARRVVRAGHKDSTGTAIPGCIPLQDDDEDDDGIDGRTVAAILTGSVAAILVAIILIDRNDDVVSPMK